MACEISSWFGRSGNNVWQLCKAVYVCKHKKMKGVSFPKHEFLKTTYISIDESSSNTEVIKDTFFYTKVDCSLEDLKKLCMEYIRPIVTFEYKEPLDDVVVHFRGGDIFSSNPHRSYVQPPLKYYTDILKGRSCIIVKEDDKNPCIKMIENGTHIHGTLKSDFETLLQSKELICGTGTFCVAVYLLSEHIQIIHMPYTMYEILPKREKDYIKFYKYEDYIKKGQWNASKNQLNLMISYVGKVSIYTEC